MQMKIANNLLRNLDNCFILTISGNANSSVEDIYETNDSTNYFQIHRSTSG